MHVLMDSVFGICATLPFLLKLIAIPVSAIVLLAFGLLLMAWPLWLILIIFAVIKISVGSKKDKENRERLKTAAAKISEKLISNLHSNHPNIMIDSIRLYSDSVLIFYTDKFARSVNIQFDTDLNFDLRGLPKMDIFFRDLADEIIRKYPLPDHEYAVHKTTQTGNRKLVGYNYRHTDANPYDNSKEVRFDPIYETSCAEITTHEIVKKNPQSQPIKQAPPKEVL